MCNPIYFSQLFSLGVHKRGRVTPLAILALFLTHLLLSSTFMPWPLSSHAGLLLASAATTTTTTTTTTTMAINIPCIALHDNFYWHWIDFAMASIWVKQTCSLLVCLLLPCSN
ncbi:hypothetical protein [Oryza sativa Japonica Group]|uniref:Uncharacterized protein n=1 Tax=Oryza sativa subsp. japonica TaxID=39947 RepID=Q5ZDK7_ORYSJ|nr:hypothetical protein [Oryza sativa Japonica Group]